MYSCEVFQTLTRKLITLETPVHMFLCSTRSKTMPAILTMGCDFIGKTAITAKLIKRIPLFLRPPLHIFHIVFMVSKIRWARAAIQATNAHKLTQIPLHQLTSPWKWSINIPQALFYEIQGHLCKQIVPKKKQVEGFHILYAPITITEAVSREYHQFLYS
jgi:hypothetical protein